MKALIQHLVRERLPQIAAASLLHCHVHGLHSILFSDEPGQRVRLFIATPEHQLHLNGINDLGSLAAHPHHCNLTLHCVQGELLNYQYRQEPGHWPDWHFAAYAYQSAILSGQGRFVRAEAPGMYFRTAQRVCAGDSLALPAHFVHSVSVAKGQQAAWFVYEGQEDAVYQPLSYSNQDLELVTFEGLYQPMSEAQVLALLASAGLL